MQARAHPYQSTVAEVVKEVAENDKQRRRERKRKWKEKESQVVDNSCIDVRVD